MQEGKIIIGLGFGDEGKGNFTSYLCSHSIHPIVIRFSGGQQAGHTVMTNKIKHVFSNYGSGTLQDIPTYFTEDTTIYLNTIKKEKDVLNKLGINPILYVHPLTKITTPFDVAYGQARELKLKHGSCGLGVGSTMNRNINTGYKLHAIDFTHNSILLEKLDMINQYYRELSYENGFSDLYIDIINEKDGYRDLFYKLINDYNEYFEIHNYDILSKYHELIFEGSQGVLLDMDHGIFPHVTYSNTTSKNAIKICKNLNIPYEVYYITRCYQTRHGNGWVSNHDRINLINTGEEINVDNLWQGKLRISELDYDLLNYSISVDNIYNESKINNLVITCLDQRKDFQFDYKKIKHKLTKIYNSHSPIFNNIKYF